MRYRKYFPRRRGYRSFARRPYRMARRRFTGRRSNRRFYITGQRF